MSGHRPWRMIRRKRPVIRELRFGENTIHARCWCAHCPWEIYPIGWYDDDGPITLEMVVEIWQGAHDDSMALCRHPILWEEVADE